MINVDRPLTPNSIKQSQFPTLQSHFPPFHPKPQKQFQQELYSSQLYKSEVNQHQLNIQEYQHEIYQLLYESSFKAKPNLQLYKQQPYLTFAIRNKLIDFLLKMSIRLKILPFVFFKAVKIFDRYCSKRIVLLDQSQLIITTCLWISSKSVGGNNHFINMHNLDKIGGAKNFKVLNDLGYGSGGKYIGPTERFRLPKLNELVKLCGNKCKYDNGMFKQMELHILTTLDWSINEASIEEFIIKSNEFNNIHDNENDANNEIFKVKEYLSYVSLYSSELIDVNIIELGQVIIDLINEVFQFKINNNIIQQLNCPPVPISFDSYKFIKKNLIKSIFNTSDYLQDLFSSKYPRYLIQQIINQYKMTTPMMSEYPVDNVNSNSYQAINYTSPTKTTTLQITPKKRNKMYSNYVSPNQQKKLHTNQMHIPPTRPEFQMITPPNSANTPIPPPLQQQSYQFPTYPNFNSPQLATYSLPPAQPPPNRPNLPNLHAQKKVHQIHQFPMTSNFNQKMSFLTKLNNNGSSSTISSQSLYENNGGNNDLFEMSGYNCNGVINNNANMNNVSTPLSENESPTYFKNEIHKNIII